MAACRNRTAPRRTRSTALIDALDACAAADLIVFSGGSSVGERDLVVDAIAARGEMIFHGIAVRPGKPTAFATIGEPADAVLRHARQPDVVPVERLHPAGAVPARARAAAAAHAAHRTRAARAAASRRRSNRHQFYTVRLRDGVALPAFKGSGDITSLSQADGYIEIPADQSVVEEGTPVDGDALLNWLAGLPIRRSYSSSRTSAVCRSKATALCSKAPRNSLWQR